MVLLKGNLRHVIDTSCLTLLLSCIRCTHAFNCKIDFLVRRTKEVIMKVEP